MTLCEAVQRGLASPAYDGGRYAFGCAPLHSDPDTGAMHCAFVVRMPPGSERGPRRPIQPSSWMLCARLRHRDDHLTGECGMRHWICCATCMQGCQTRPHLMLCAAGMLRPLRAQCCTSTSC